MQTMNKMSNNQQTKDMTVLSPNKFNKVLIVDDDLVNILIATKLIKYTNFCNQVVSFASAEEALIYLQKTLEKGEEELPDVIFLDNIMPMMSGEDFIEEFRHTRQKMTKKISVYMLSSFTEDKSSIILKGVDDIKDFIPKPLTKEVLDTIKSQL